MSARETVSSLKDVLDGIFNDGTLPFTRDDLRIWDIWAEVVGPAVAANARPARIKNGVLRITVSDSIWLQELKYLEETIREGLNNIIGRPAVSKVEFKLKLR